MGSLVRWVVGIAVAVGLVAGSVACSAGGEPAGLAAGTVVLDVRTPAEFAAGHLDGAVNVDVQSPDFAARVAQLDPAATYVVYCRSGNRAGVAAEYLAGQGFAHVTNIGGLDAASRSTGLAVVTS